MDITDFPTDSIAGLKVSNFFADLVLSDETIALPEGYCLLDEEGEMVTALSYGIIYTIGLEPKPEDAEAIWGTSATNLTAFGTLAEAIAAAADTTAVKYIRLQQDVTTTYKHIIQAGVFTLDLNGKTLSQNYYTLDIRNEGTHVTLTDSSSEGNGQVISTDASSSAVSSDFGAQVTIEKGTYEGGYAVLIAETGIATIKDGTFHTNSNCIIQNLGSLYIEGGLFEGEEGLIAAININMEDAYTHISGGTFTEGSYGHIIYYGGKLDLTDFPIDNLVGLKIMNLVADLVVSSETIALPKGYCLLDRYGDKATTLSYEYYTIGLEPKPEDAEAIWGSSADDLTAFGSLMKAITAAQTDTANVKYIRLQNDVTNIYYINSGIFTLDLNGKTLSNDDYTLVISNEGTHVTITDNSEDKTGKVIRTTNTLGAILVYEKAQLTIEEGYYEGAFALLVLQEAKVAINGGTFFAKGGYGVLNFGIVHIAGGSFDGEAHESSVAMSDFTASTTISGGMFTEGTFGHFEYAAGTLDLINYPTNTLNGMTLSYVAEEQMEMENNGYFLLPDGYTLQNTDGTEAETLQPEGKYTFGPTATDVQNVMGDMPANGTRKVLQDGQILILRDGKTYNLLGNIAK